MAKKVANTDNATDNQSGVIENIISNDNNIITVTDDISKETEGEDDVLNDNIDDVPEIKVDSTELELKTETDIVEDVELDSVKPVQSPPIMRI
jgi:hypothetical protein